MSSRSGQEAGSPRAGRRVPGPRRGRDRRRRVVGVDPEPARRLAVHERVGGDLADREHEVLDRPDREARRARPPGARAPGRRRCPPPARGAYGCASGGGGRRPTRSRTNARGSVNSALGAQPVHPRARWDGCAGRPRRHSRAAARCRTGRATRRDGRRRRDVWRRLVVHVGAHGLRRSPAERLLGHDPRSPVAARRMVVEEAEDTGEHRAVLGVEHVGVDEVDLSASAPSSSRSQPSFSGVAAASTRSPPCTPSRANAATPSTKRAGVLVEQRVVPVACGTAVALTGDTRLHSLVFPACPLRACVRRTSSAGAPTRRSGPRARGHACRRRRRPGTGRCRSSAAGGRRSAQPSARDRSARLDGPRQGRDSP